MPDETSRGYARYIFKQFNLVAWPLVVLLTGALISAFIMSQWTSGYWAGGLALYFMVFIVGVQSAFLLKNVMTYEKDQLDKHMFIDTFNWLGLNLVFICMTGIASVVTSAVFGVNYAKDRNATEIEHGYFHEEYVNVDENRIVGIVLVVLSVLAILLAGRGLCIHGEIRRMLSIPEKNPNTTPARPSPAPPAAAPSTSTPANTSNNNNNNNTPPNTTTRQRTAEELKAENAELERKTKRQREEIERLLAFSQQLQCMPGIPDTRQPPPDYRTLYSPPPGYQPPDVAPS